MTTSLPDRVAKLSFELEDETASVIGVHTLSEFVYCKRAGQISADSRQDDTGSEMPLAPALGGLPTHDLDMIYAELHSLREQMKYPIAWNLGLWLAATLLGILFTPLLLLALLPALYFSAKWLYVMLRKHQSLKARLRIAQRAAEKEPDWNLRQCQPINWWSLIRAGFASVEKQEPLFDPQLRLVGKPWRVLHRGGTEYPVLQIRVNQDQHDRRREGRLSRQQLARIAAYAYLLNRCERAESSWAIVLFGKTYEGIAVPVDDHAWMSFQSGLLMAREELAEHQTDPHSRPDPNLAACVNCPLGKPKLLRNDPVLKNGVEITPFGTETPQGKVYHSTCGDHYRWIPPHETAGKLGLPC